MRKKVQKYFGRIISIDYLKGIAIVFVVLAHSLTKAQRLKIAGPFWISMAVPIFMIISGFTNTLSANRNGLNELKEFYSKTELKREFLKIFRPYFIILLIEYLIGVYQLIVLKTGPFISFALKDYFFYFLTGGTTPGSYYIPILLQLILLFPLMLTFFKKSPKYSTIFFLAVHFLFDLLANYLPIPTEIYRLLIFRYLAFILLGSLSIITMMK